MDILFGLHRLLESTLMLMGHRKNPRVVNGTIGTWKERASTVKTNDCNASIYLRLGIKVRSSCHEFH